MCVTMYIDKVILMIVLCATNISCSDGTLARNARTISSSLFTWPQILFKNQPNFSVIPKFWSNRAQIREWTMDGIVSLIRFISFHSGKEPMQIKFAPEDGPRAAAAYQRRYGYRGERLIEQLGNGFDPDRQPAPSIFLTPPLPPFRSSNSFNSQ